MFISYIKLAVKVLMRRKFFTFVSLFGIAFTLMVLIVLAALMQHTRNAGKPEVFGNRSLYINSILLTHQANRNTTRTAPGYQFLDRHIRNLPGVENYSISSRFKRVVAYKGDQKVVLNLKRTDGRFWEVMAFDFLEGTGFSREDEAMGRHVAVINKATRDYYFGGESALGKTLEANGQSFRVVGVVDNVAFYKMASFSDVWVPLSSAKSSNYRHQLLGEMNAILVAESRAQFSGIKEALAAELPKVTIPDPERWDTVYSFADTRMEMVARGFFASLETEPGVGKLLGIMFTLMLLFMLLPAVNLINLNMSRIMERYSEIGVRKAFGATSFGLAGQFLIENLVLTVIGGLIGLALAQATLSGVNNANLIPYADLRVNLAVFAYCMLFSTIFGVLSGVYPAWRMSRQHPVAALKGGL